MSSTHSSHTQESHSHSLTSERSPRDSHSHTQESHSHSSTGDRSPRDRSPREKSPRKDKSLKDKSHKDKSHKDKSHKDKSHKDKSHKESRHSSEHVSTVQQSDRGVTTSIKGNIHEQPITTGKAEVLVRTKETWDTEALQKLEESLAIEKAAMIDAQKQAADQEALYKEALATKENKIREAQKFGSVVGERETQREKWLAEERELELKRAAAHARAVELESLRTEALAQATLSKEEAKVSDSLSAHRAEGIKQAQALVDAHKLAIQKLESYREELKRKEVDVAVRGEALPNPKAVDINVAVKPKELPEARIEAGALSTGAAAQAHIKETLPTHEKTFVAPKEVQAVHQHAEQTTVEHHVVTKKDAIIG